MAIMALTGAGIEFPRIEFPGRRYNFIVGWFFLSSCDERIETSLILIKPDCKSGESDPWRSFCI
jgi:hypothetical protein